MKRMEDEKVGNYLTKIGMKIYVPEFMDRLSKLIGRFVNFNDVLRSDNLNYIYNIMKEENLDI